MKKCSRCNETKPLEAFSKQRKANDGLQTWCKDCINGRYALTATHHKGLVKKRKQRIKAENRVHMLEYLQSHPCTDCGEEDFIVLEFDHVGVKSKNISDMLSNGDSWHQIEQEIAQCEVVCSNCHRRRTYQRLPDTWRAI